MAGSASVNPVFFTLSVLLILAWKPAGYWGLIVSFCRSSAHPGSPISRSRRKNERPHLRWQIDSRIAHPKRDDCATARSSLFDGLWYDLF